MRTIILVLIMLTLCAPLQSLADNQPINIRTSYLDKTYIEAGTLKIRFSKFKPAVLKFNNGNVEIQAENSTNKFVTFYPQRLSFVDNYNDQINILAILSSNDYFTATERLIAPGAKIKELYELNGKIQLPTRVFYEEKLIAIISE
jgi:hypothetical protein